jgi:hypothetical protein
VTVTVARFLLIDLHPNHIHADLYQVLSYRDQKQPGRT